jgi:hypothetical protein
VQVDGGAALEVVQEDGDGVPDNGDTVERSFVQVSRDNSIRWSRR